MDASAFSKVFWGLACLCLFLLLANRNVDEQAPSQGWVPADKSVTPESVPATVTKQFPQFYAAYQKALNASDESAKLAAIEQALAIAKAQGFEQPRMLANLYRMQANIHQSRWHYHFALESLRQAQLLEYHPDVDKRIQQLEKHLAKIDGERHKKDHYIVTPDTGPAKELRGKVLVAYIFIDDGIRTRWSDKSVLRTQSVLSNVQQWHQRKARDYQVDDLQYINKVFMVQRNPSLKMLSKVSFTGDRTALKKFVDIVMQHLGAKDVGDFIQRQMAIAGAEQGAIIFHSNFNQRSFARRCGYTHQKISYENGERKVEMFSRCQDEYVMLMDKVQRNNWQKLEYTQAHEILHLFGADDLYNISSAESFYVTDIMNFNSRYLSDSEISPITAFAIGWQSQVPLTPFNIVEK